MLKNENYKIEFLIIKIIISEIADKHNAFAYRYVFSIFPARELHFSLADTFLIPFQCKIKKLCSALINSFISYVCNV